MASVTATAKPEAARSVRARPHPTPPSRIGRLIVILNLVGLALLVGGALLLNELRQGLVDARIESLSTEGELIANVIDQAATVGDPEPLLEADAASDILQSLDVPKSAERARLFDSEGHLIADSYVAADRVESSDAAAGAQARRDVVRLPGLRARAALRRQAADKALREEIAVALSGATKSHVRPSESGGRVVVGVDPHRARPRRGRRADPGVQRRRPDHRAPSGWRWCPSSSSPSLVNLISSFAMTQLIAQPVRRLSDAADSVRLSRARAIALPDIAARRDELGDLARSLQDMTHTLSDRMEAIERFAADVAHEIRNPLTSIRSAVETLELVKDQKARDRLLAILKQDVSRLDRLITDISNASRLDAELSRELAAADRAPEAAARDRRPLRGRPARGRSACAPDRWTSRRRHRAWPRGPARARCSAT